MPDKAAEAWAELILGDDYGSVSGRFYRHLEPIEPPDAATDAAAQRQLWEESERLAGLNLTAEA